MESKSVDILHENYDMWENYVEKLKNREVEELWYPQWKALEEGALDEGNFLLVSSAGSGKTLVSEIVIANEYFSKGKKSVYLVPYNSLVEEKYSDFQELFPDLKISKSTEVDRQGPGELFDSNIVIMTYEKFDFYLRNFADQFDEIGCIVIDELHNINGETRGPILELLITKLLKDHSDTKMVGLSATAPNCEEIADWMNAELVDAGDWRKNELVEGVHYTKKNKTVFYEEDGEKNETEDINSHGAGPREDVVLDYINKDNNQALVFADTRRKAKNTAESLKDFVEQHTKSYDFNLNEAKLDRIVEVIDEISSSEGSLIRELKSCIKKGVAFHHAGLSNDVKKVLENGFRQGHLKAICSTTTLAAGVNLPAQRLFILEPKAGGEDLTVSDYKNLAGRAGRPKFTSERGESVLLSRNESTARPLISRYITGSPESVESQIDLKERSDLLLNLLRGNKNIDEVRNFIEKTFMNFQGGSCLVDKEGVLAEVLESLEKLEMLTFDGEQFELTDLGIATSKKLLDPNTASLLINHLEGSDEFDIDDFILSALSCEEFDKGYRMYVQGNPDTRKVKSHMKHLGLTHLESDEMERTIVTTLILKDWLDGRKLDEMLKDNPINDSYHGAGDVSGRIKPRLVHVMNAIIEILEESKPELFDNYKDQLEELRIRLKHGLRKNMVPFVRNDITTKRSLIKHLIDHLEINHPRDLLDKNPYDMHFQAEQAFKLKRRAMLGFLGDGFEKEKELVLLNAKEENMDVNLYREVLETDQDEFKDICINALKKEEAFFVDEVDEEGQTMEPEAVVRIKKGGEYLAKDGHTIEIGLECKSKKNLDGVVGDQEAVVVDMKAPNCDSRVTVGTPGFVESAPDAAKNNDVLLISSPAFVELLVCLKKFSPTPKEIFEFFDQAGEIDRKNVWSYFQAL